MDKTKLLLAGLAVLIVAIGVGAYVVTTAAALPDINAPQPSALAKMMQEPQLGSILTDSKGRALYTFVNDVPGENNCTDKCSQMWRPFVVAQGVQPWADQSASGGKLTVLQLPDGRDQVTLNDKPLYYFTRDAKPGKANGNRFGDLWSVVTVNDLVPAPSSCGGSAS